MLYGLGMLVWAVPPHVLVGDISVGVMEAVSWMKEVAKEDPDEKARTLAIYALSIFNAKLKELNE